MSEDKGSIEEEKKSGVEEADTPVKTIILVYLGEEGTVRVEKDEALSLTEMVRALLYLIANLKKVVSDYVKPKSNKVLKPGDAVYEKARKELKVANPFEKGGN